MNLRTYLRPLAPNRAKHEHYIMPVVSGYKRRPVAEEAAHTARHSEITLNVFTTLGTGIHRLFNRLEDIQGALAS